MHLIGVKEENGWDISRWELTYNVGWEHILRGITSIYDFYDNTEVLVDNKTCRISQKDDIMSIPENRSMIVRGLSKIIGVPIMITFYNQTNIVDVSVAQVVEEFKHPDYEKFNHSLCQYMDSIELAMYRK